MRSLVIMFFLLHQTVSFSQQAIDKLFVDSAWTLGGYDIIQTSDNGFALSGIAIMTVQNQPIRNGYLCKTDPAYNFNWANRYHEAPSNDINLMRILQLPDNSYLALLEITDSLPGNSYGFRMAIMRMDSAGQILYVTQISDSIEFHLHRPFDMIAVSDSTFYLLSRLEGNIGDIGLCKIDISGNILGSMAFRFSSASHTASPVAITRLMNGKYLVTGTANSTSSFMHTLFYFFDENLTLLSHQSYHLTSSGTFPADVFQDADSSIWLIGSTANKPMIMKLTQSAELLWTKIYLPSVFTSQAFRQGLYRDGYILAFGNDHYASPGYPYVVKLDTGGNVLNTRTFEHNVNSYYFLDVINKGDSLVWFNHATFTEAIQGTSDGIAVTDTALTSGCSNDLIQFTASNESFTEDSSIYVEYYPMVSSDITNSFQFVPLSLFDMQLCNTTSIQETRIESILIFPNPVSRDLKVKIPGDHSIAILEMYSVSGARIYNCIYSTNNEISIDVSALSDGIYTMRITPDKGKSFSQRFVKINN